MADDVSTFRLYLMRLLYALNFVALGFSVWSAIFKHTGDWDPVRGVAYAFWAALSALSGLGIRYPLKMLPVLLMQMLYKLLWILTVYLPLKSAGKPTELGGDMIGGFIVDLIVIPWPYVVAAYVKKRGDRWRPAVRPASA